MSWSMNDTGWHGALDYWLTTPDDDDDDDDFEELEEIEDDEEFDEE